MYKVGPQYDIRLPRSLRHANLGSIRSSTLYWEVNSSHFPLSSSSPNRKNYSKDVTHPNQSHSLTRT